MCKSLCVLFHVYMCMYRRAFQWQHFGSPAEVLLRTKAHFPPLNCEVQQFIFTGAWWFVNGCEDTVHAVIHGAFPHSPWGLLLCSISLQELIHYHSGKLKMLCRKVAEENYRSFFFLQPLKLKSVAWAAALNLVLVHRGCVVFGLFATLYYCTCFPVGLWHFSFRVSLLRWPGFSAGG